MTASEEKKKPLILGIDPGNKETGYVLADGETLKPIRFGKVDNYTMLDEIEDILGKSIAKGYELHIAIENIRSYGMAVGKEVFDTCIWIGRYWQFVRDYQYYHHIEKIKMMFVYRSEEKQVICHSPKANDATIRQALIDRFAPGVPNYGKGTKAEPGFFRGFRADIWSAMAILTTYHDLHMTLHVTDLPF